MADPVDPQNVFDAYYYQHGCGAPYIRNEAWLAFFQGIADRLIEDIQPKTVLDAGCALGFLVEGFRNRGIEAWGVDISEYAIASVHESIREFCSVGSVTEPFARKFDLIVTIEVAEHLQPVLSNQMIANLCAHTDDIIFTSTPFDYKETTHFNVQPPEVWSREFARHGFFRDVDYDASFITAWAVRYCRRDLPVHQLIFDYERRFWLLQKENTDLRQLSIELRNQTRQMETQIQDLNGRLQAAAQTYEQACQTMQNQHAQEMAELADVVHSLQAEIQSLTESLAQSQAESENLRNEIQQAQVDKTHMTGELADLSRQLAEQQRQAEELAQRWQALEQTRTWKVLTALYRLRKPGKQG